MSPPFADQPAALPQAPSVLTMAAPFGDPELSFTSVYSTGIDSTAPTSLCRALPMSRVKQQLALLAAMMLVVLHSLHSYAMPPTPAPTENNQARIQHGGFLRDTFQVSNAYKEVSRGRSMLLG